MAGIHPLALVSSAARIGRDVSIGPYAIVEDDVELGDRCQVAGHAVIKSGTVLGADNQVWEGAVLGGFPQHAHMPEHIGTVVVGTGNTFREHCTVHRAMHAGSVTRIGNGNLLMAGAHVAHDCVVGNHTIFANNVLLAGHVTVQDRAFVSGAVGVHQFCRIGRLAMVGGHARVTRDVPPFITVDGASGYIVGLNLIGLRRAGITPAQVAELKAAYRVVYRSGLAWHELLECLRTQFTSGPAAEFYPFFSTGKRGFCQERRMPPGATLKIRRADEDEAEEPALRARAG